MKSLPTENNNKNISAHGGDPAYKEMMELRLQETMSEAKRHHQSYMDIRQ